MLFKVKVQKFFARIGPCTHHVKKSLLEFLLELFCMVRYRVETPLARTSANRDMILSFGTLTDSFHQKRATRPIWKVNFRSKSTDRKVPIWIFNFRSKSLYTVYLTNKNICFAKQDSPPISPCFHFFNVIITGNNSI